MCAFAKETVLKQIKNNMLLMKKNPFYTAPEAEFLVVRFEENLLTSGGAGGDDTIIDDDDDY